MEEFNDTLLLHMHIRHCFVRLLPSVAQQQNIVGKVQPLLPYHQHPTLMSWDDRIEQEALLSEEYSYTGSLDALSLSLSTPRTIFLML